MSLSRLIELSAIAQPTTPTQVDEAQVSTSEFHRIQDFVNDSLADLEDALGPHGSLSQFAGDHVLQHLSSALSRFKAEVEHGLTNIEVDIMADEAIPSSRVGEAIAGGKKDDTANIVSTQGGKTTVTNGKVIRSIGDSHTVKTADGRTVQVRGKIATNEALVLEGKKDYEDSSDFTEDLMSVGTHIHELKKLTRAPKWMAWMAATDHNYSTSAEALAGDFNEALTVLDKAHDALEDELHSAG